MTDGGTGVGECIDSDDECLEKQDSAAYDYFPNQKPFNQNINVQTFFDEEYENENDTSHPGAFPYMPAQPKTYANLKKLGSQDNHDKVTRNTKAYDEVYNVCIKAKNSRISCPEPQKIYDESIEVEKTSTPPFDSPLNENKLNHSLQKILTGSSKSLITNPAQNIGKWDDFFKKSMPSKSKFFFSIPYIYIGFNLNSESHTSYSRVKGASHPELNKQIFDNTNLKNNKGKDQGTRPKVNKNIKDKKLQIQSDKSKEQSQSAVNTTVSKEQWSIDKAIRFVEGCDQNDTKKKKKKKKSRNRKASNDSTVKYHDDSSEEQYPSPNVQTKATVLLSENSERKILFYIIVYCKK